MKCNLIAGYCVEQTSREREVCSGLPQTEKCPHREPSSPCDFFNPGEKVRCIRDSYTMPEGLLKKGQVYTVLERAFTTDIRLVEVVSKTDKDFHPSWSVERFEKVETVKLTETPTTDLDTMLALLKPVTKVRAWRIKEYLSKEGEVVQFEGTVLIHGSEDDGPYTEYLFDPSGKLVRAASYYAEGLKSEVA